MDDAEDNDDDAFNDRASTSESNVGFDSPSEGSSAKEDEWRLDVLNRMGRTEDHPISSGTPTHSEPKISENALERERYSEGPLEPCSAHEIHGTPDHDSVPYKNLSPIPTSMSSLQRAEAGVATAIGEANREHRLAAEKDETGATATLTPPAEEKDTDIKFIKFVDAIGRRFRFSFHLVKTWLVCALISRLFFRPHLTSSLRVPNLNLRVADGEYDLFGPQEEILSPSNWESVIEPDWEITMRMWPDPGPPPWEDASPMAMLQAGENFRAGKEDERLKCSISQQEQNVSYRNSEPSLLRGPGAYSEDASPMAMLRARNNFRAESGDERLKRSIPQQEQNAPYRDSEPLLFRDPGAYRGERPANYAVGDVGIEERRPRTWNELRPYTTEKPTTELDAVRRPRDRSRSPSRRRHRERNTDDLPLGEERTPDGKAPEEGTQHESDTVRRRGNEVEDPQAKEPSDEAGWAPIYTPSVSERGAVGPLPSRPVRGGRQHHQRTENRQQIVGPAKGRSSRSENMPQSGARRDQIKNSARDIHINTLSNPQRKRRGKSPGPHRKRTKNHHAALLLIRTNLLGKKKEKRHSFFHPTSKPPQRWTPEEIHPIVGTDRATSRRSSIPTPPHAGHGREKTTNTSVIPATEDLELDAERKHDGACNTLMKKQGKECVFPFG